MTFLVNNLVLACFNVINVFVDAYKIKVLHKAIRHGVNFGLYLALTTALILLKGLSWENAILFCVSAFCNRQLTFDIPLNWKRRLKWDYVTPETDFKKMAVLDWLEKKIFGMDGRTPVYIYAAVLIVCSIIHGII